ncbi:hypothetical protein D3C86_1847640 [compost metagenome]
MAMTELTTLEQIRAVLNADARSKPARILVHAKGCPPCQEVHEKMDEVAQHNLGIEFYAHEAVQYVELKALFKELGFKLTGYPTQILISQQGHLEFVVGGNKGIETLQDLLP